MLEDAVEIPLKYVEVVICRDSLAGPEAVTVMRSYFTLQSYCCLSGRDFWAFGMASRFRCSILEGLVMFLPMLDFPVEFIVFFNYDVFTCVSWSRSGIALELCALLGEAGQRARIVEMDNSWNNVVPQHKI